MFAKVLVIGIIKIRPEGNNILVANKLGEDLRNYQIIKEEITSFDEPLDIEPLEIPASRLEELKYFEQFVDQEHKFYIGSNY